MNFAAKLFRSRLLPVVVRHKDLAVGFLLVVFTLFVVRDLVVGGTVVGKDTITQYYTWYSYLGERLRSGDIPAWNPYQFSGAPFAGDPLSWGFGLAEPEEGASRGGHGSTREMRVPLLISGAGVKAGAVPKDARLVDVAPTVAALLGVRPPADTQGRVLDELLYG